MRAETEQVLRASAMDSRVRLPPQRPGRTMALVAPCILIPVPAVLSRRRAEQSQHLNQQTVLGVILGLIPSRIWFRAPPCSPCWMRPGSIRRSLPYSPRGRCSERRALQGPGKVIRNQNRAGRRSRRRLQTT